MQKKEIKKGDKTIKNGSNNENNNEDNIINSNNIEREPERNSSDSKIESKEQICSLIKRSNQQTFFEFSEYMKQNLKENKLKLNTIQLSITKKIKNVAFKQQPLLLKFQKCNSKMDLYRIFRSLSKKWKTLIKKYLSSCFIMHLHIRQIINITQLLRKRDILYESLDNPDILLLCVQFENNLVKNFCKGLVCFITAFYNNIVEEEMISVNKTKNKN